MLGTPKKLYYSRIQKIAIFRALQLGDLLCTVPALRGLRKRFPDAAITLIGLPWSRQYVERFSRYLDEFIEFPGYPGFPEVRPQLDRIPDFLAETQNNHFDLVLQMQGSGLISNSLCILFGARFTGGFYLPGQYCPDENWFIEYPVHEPEIMRHIRLVESLGGISSGPHLEFPLTPIDEEKFVCLREKYPIDPNGYLCIHAGSRSVDRRWPAHRFAAVGNYFAKAGYQIVLTGTMEERQITQLVLNEMEHPVLDLTGETDLGTLGMLVRGARLVVCNDTGIAHIADALDVPSVVLFSASDPRRWGPLDRNLHRVVEWASAATPQIVIDEAKQLLAMESANVT